MQVFNNYTNSCFWGACCPRPSTQHEKFCVARMATGGNPEWHEIPDFNSSVGDASPVYASIGVALFNIRFTTSTRVEFAPLPRPALNAFSAIADGARASLHDLIMLVTPILLIGTI